MSMADWDRTSWAEQRLLREGLEHEAPWVGRAVMLNKADNSLDLKKGLFADIEDEDDGEGSAEDLGALGMNVKVSQKMTPVYRSASG